MEVFMHGIPFHASELSMHEHFEKILHGSPFSDLWKMGYPMNFTIFFHRRRPKSRAKTGVIRIPDEGIAQLLISRSPFLPALHGVRIKMARSKDGMDPRDVETLRQSPYRDPEILREQIELKERLGSSVCLNMLQFGWLDRDQIFSPEWTRSYTDSLISASIKFDGNRRELTIQETSIGLFGGYIPRRIVIRFGNVETLSYSQSGDPICAVLLTLRSPPVFEELSTPPPEFLFLSEETRTRHSSLHDNAGSHSQVAPYTSSEILLSMASKDSRQQFLDMCSAAQLPKPTQFLAPPAARGHFSAEALAVAERFIKALPWPVAFQVLALLRDLVLSAKELVLLRGEIATLVQQYHSSRAADIVKQFGLELHESEWLHPSHNSHDQILASITRCFRTACRSPSSSFRELPDDLFTCYHVAVTPTSVLPQGPYPDQSNRVLRRYKNNQSCFLRVNFTDEERLEYRFEREVNGEEFVKRRVGRILKEGLEIAGRKFQFLAYSNSALKEHAVWFVTPFLDENEDFITADVIRSRLGNFDKVIRCPARYGARMSQAFTSTSVSISITAEEVIQLPDILAIVNNKPIVFTDGIGTCSRGTMDQIAGALRESTGGKKKRRRHAFFSAVQIRLAGHKGMIIVDHKLSGDTIFVRDSMNKFSFDYESLDVEIADVFDRPKPMFLNRPLIMILETLGVPIQSFLDLQQAMIVSITSSTHSMEHSAQLLATHGLGTAFRIPSVLLGLAKMGLPSPPTEDKFLARGLDYAVNHVLRCLKHRARIHVPDSWTLVGVADFHRYLAEGEVFACVRDRDGKKKYLEGRVLVTRSPAIHPGDVQMAHAIGPPKRGSPFKEEELPNCIVFSCRGSRSLPQSLGGGDLDGDLYNVMQCEDLFPERTVEPAAYDPTVLKQLPEGQRCTIDHVADFVVDFINNDHLGIISQMNLIRADQSAQMSLDPGCLKLAQLHSIAVDFQKSGKPADLRSIPKGLKMRPDWSADELAPNYKQLPENFYESRRALGVLFRNVALPELRPPRQKKAGRPVDVDDVLDRFKNVSMGNGRILDDPVTLLIQEKLSARIDLGFDGELAEHFLIPQFEEFSRHLSSICAACSLSRRPLMEEECWAGTIIAKSSQHRRRNDLQAHMRQQCTIIADQIREDLADPDDTEEWLIRTWVAWNISRRWERTFGAKIYGYLALGSMFEALTVIQQREESLYH